MAGERLGFAKPAVSLFDSRLASLQCRAHPGRSCLPNCLIFVNIVQPDSFLTLHYRLSGPDGAEVVSTFDDKPATLSLGAGQLAPAIEACLVGMEEGARMTWHLEAGAAYGERNPEMLQRVKRSLLHAQLQAAGYFFKYLSTLSIPRSMIAV